MSGKPEVVPLLLLKGRSILFREYSKKSLSELSKDLRKRNFEKLYILDVDGVERNKPQLDVIQALSDDFSIFSEGGPRKGANVIDFVIAGAEKVYMNTYSMSSLYEEHIALSYSENIGLKIDWNDGVQGYGEGIEGSEISKLMRDSLEYGIRDFAVPAEIVSEAEKHLAGSGSALSAIADRPGEESLSDERVDFLIVPIERLPGSGKND